MGRRSRSGIAAGLTVLLAAGCASTPEVPIRGRPVTVLTENGESKVEGELLTVDSRSLWVQEPEGVVEVPLPAVREVRVRQHGLGGGAATGWALLGGLVTGGLIGGACASVEGTENCGVAGLVVAGLWMVVGLLAAPSMEASSRLDLWKPTPEQLRAFARLPQGWPESLRAPTLGSPPKGEDAADTEDAPRLVE